MDAAFRPRSPPAAWARGPGARAFLGTARTHPAARGEEQYRAREPLDAGELFSPAAPASSAPRAQAPLRDEPQDAFAFARGRLVLVRDERRQAIQARARLGPSWKGVSRHPVHGQARL